MHDKDIISSAKLGGYGNNVNSMLNAVENAYDTIISNKGSHDDYIMHIFKALMSIKNSIFKDYIQDYKNKWEDDDAIITSVYLIAKSKYANMVKSKDWGRNDPSNAQLIALMTKFNGSSSNTSNKGENMFNKNKSNDSKKLTQTNLQSIQKN